MRLTSEQILAVKEVVLMSDPQARIYLFGSRADDLKRGGDIDLLIMSSTIHLDERRKIKIRLFDKLGEQKIDIVVASDARKPFVRIAQREGILL